MKKHIVGAGILLFVGLIAFSGCVSTSRTASGPAQISVRLKNAETTVATIDKYGNCTLAITEDDLESEGYAVGDIVHVTLGTFSFEAPVCTNYSDVDNGKFLVKTGKGQVQLAVNMGNLAKKSAAAENVPVTIALVNKGGYLTEYKIRQLKKSENRSDYSSDAVFANFRTVTAGKIAKNRLYRSCNPVYTDARAPYAEKLTEQAGIKTVLNLADSEKSASGQLASTPYYAKLVENGNVIFLDMGVSFTDKDFTDKLHDGLVFLGEHPDGPYLIHCNEGKDRAGFVSAILEALNGATLEEMTTDYMLSYRNYYNVIKGTEQYRLISKTIPDMFKTINGGKAVTDKTVGKATETYLRKTIGLTTNQISALRANLQ